MYPRERDRTWIVLADSSRARIYLTDHDLNEARLIRELDHPESRIKESELATGMKGSIGPRQRGSGNRGNLHGHRPSTDPQTGAHQVELEKFAREIAQELEHARVQGACEEIVLAAPPQFLGLIRQFLKVDVERMVRARISKNLVRIEERDVAERIRDELFQAGRG